MSRRKNKEFLAQSRAGAKLVGKKKMCRERNLTFLFLTLAACDASIQVLMPSVNCSHAMNTFMCVCQNTKNPAFSFETSKSSSKPNCVLSEAQQKRLRIGAVFIFCRYNKYLIVTLHFIAVFMDKLFVVVNQAARYAAIQVKPNYACSKPMRLYQTE